MMAWFSVFVVTLTTILSLSTKPTFSVEHGDAVKLSQPTPSSFDTISVIGPFIFSSSRSFSSQLRFQSGGNGVALVIIPSNFSRNILLGVEFYANVCKLLPYMVSNVSKTSKVLKDGVKVHTWIDYQATAKRLDVSVSMLDDPKPVEPLISHGIDLWELLKGEGVLLSLVSLNEKHEKSTILYSWVLDIEGYPTLYAPYSSGFDLDGPIPDDPQEHTTSTKNGGFLPRFIFVTGCAVLAALVMFFVWSYVVNRQKVKGEASVHPVDCKFEKIDVLKVKKSEIAMN